MRQPNKANIVDIMEAVIESGYKFPVDSYFDIVYWYRGPVTGKLRAVVIRRGKY